MPFSHFQKVLPMKKLALLLLLAQSGIILAQTKTLITTNGEKVIMNINTVNTADNGLTKTGENVQLGGDLIHQTIISTSSTNTMAVTGLQDGSSTDNIVAIEPLTGILKKISQSPYLEPWQVGNSTTLASLNTQKIYQNGYVGIGDFSASNPLTNLDIRGSVRTGIPNIGVTIGTNSFAGGNNTEASGLNSFAFGAPYGTNSAAKASGSNSAAFGCSTASGFISFAAGNGNIASGNYSTALGQSNTSAAQATFTAGVNNNTNANYSFAVGQQNSIDAAATVSFAAGYFNKIFARQAAAIGSSNTINGESSVALGAGNKTDNSGSIAMGSSNNALAQNSIAMGFSNTILAGSNYSVAMGTNNQIGTTNASFAALATGQNNIVNGNFSTAVGQNNTISGPNGTIIGSNASIPTGIIGSTILADSMGATVLSTEANQFTGMFNGGYRILTNRANLTKGMIMDALGNANFSGTISSAGTVVTSDMRLKKDILTLTGTLNNIKQLRGVNYYWKDTTKGTDRQLGMIAQEMEKVYPELVNTNKETGIKSVNYSQFTGVLLEGIKEQQTQIDALKFEVETLKKEIQEIKELLKK
jgi:hypothetical protein